MTTEASNSAEHRNPGFVAWMVVAWSMAGGILLGGVYVAFLTSTSRMSTVGQIPVMTLFFATGSLLGLLHGSILGYLGRPRDVDRATALRGLALGALGAVPGLAVAWVLTLWIGITGASRATRGLLPVVGIALGWVGGAAICYLAVRQGWQAARATLERWADARLGGSLLAGAFLLLSAAFLVVKPEIWFTEVRVTRAGAVLLALGATVWIGGPLVVLTLKLLRNRSLGREEVESP